MSGRESGSSSIPEELQEVVERLKRVLRVRAVILFGSRARGDWGPWSDYDLLIVADFDEPYLERIKRVLDILADVRLPIEPHPYTLEEAMNMLQRGNPLIVDALEEGIVLYRGPEFEKIERLYHELKRRGLRRTRTSVVIPDNVQRCDAS